jgi:small subunit ribosomal protein S7
MRKAKSRKREILPDPRFNDKLVTQFVNNMMYDGKKSISYQIFYDALEIVTKRLKDSEEPAIDVWKKGLENVTPQVEVKSRRVGGATFQVPMEIRADRKIAVSMKHMITYARSRKGKSMSEKLAAEIVDAFHEEGGAFKRKEEIHRMADANKAFAHFRF